MELPVNQQAEFEALWRDKVEPLAKDAPYIFSSPYYAHKGAAQEIGEQFVDEADRPAWHEFAYKKYHRMSNYAGD